MEKLLTSRSKSHLRVKLGAADGRLIRTAGFEVCCPSPRQSRAAPPAAPTSLILGLSKVSAVSGLNHRSGARRKVTREGGRGFKMKQELHLVLWRVATPPPLLDRVVKKAEIGGRNKATANLSDTR